MIGKSSRSLRENGYCPIEDYAVIADGRSAALVAADGRIDWWPVPALDSPPVCAALVDPDAGGYFGLVPEGDYSVERRYVEGTNVLSTTYTTQSGTVDVTECLNVGAAGRLPWIELVRRVECLDGRVAMQWEFAPGGRFGSARPSVTERDGLPIVRVADQTLAVIVDGGEPARTTPGSVTGRFEVTGSERVLIAVVASDSEPLYVPSPHAIERRIRRTVDSWCTWTSLISYEGGWRQEVIRSALALKSLLYEPGGAIAAAATTSLPEWVGGNKNWDYRFAWVRDSSFTVDALIELALEEEVQAAVSWLLAAIDRSDRDLHVFYTLGGEPADDVEEIDLPGYKASRPVRIGNRANRQIQLGNFGDLFETIHRYLQDGHLIDGHTAEILRDLADRCSEQWVLEDSGIWELQDTKHYTISKIGCWVALDRAALMAESGQLPGGDASRWRATADEIRRWVNENCWSADSNSYVMCAGGNELDASTLLAGRTGFDRGSRLASTIEAVLRHLGVEGSPLLYRYSGMDLEEGAFVACTFWLVEALVFSGQMDRARHLMNEAIGLTNGLGLFSEQIDPSDGSFLGNFPQGLSHLALVNAAHAIAKAAPGRDQTQSQRSWS